MPNCEISLLRTRCLHFIGLGLDIEKKQIEEANNEDLINAPWHVSDIFTCVEDKYDYWRGLFENIANQHAPIKRKRVREKDIPYTTQEWKSALRNKRKYAKKFAEDRTAENLELKRKYRNIATRERRKAI